MREIEVSQITDIVEKLCIAANEHLPEDVKCAIRSCRACEDGQIAQGILDNIIENFEIADNECVPICQDTGMACVFLEIGQDVHFVGGDLTEAVNEGVRRGYDKGYLRKAVVKDPVRRGLKKRCSKRSTSSESARRASAARRRPSASTSRPCRLILPACRALSTSTAM